MPHENPSILIVDDEYSVRDSLEHWFRKDGYRTGNAENAKQALDRIRDSSWDLVLLDIRMPGMDGLELQKRLHEIQPRLTVIIMTAFASVESAVEALKSGAFDYITKPIDPEELSQLVRRAIDQRRLISENERLREKVEQLATPGPIVGESDAMRKTLELVRSVSETDATVLIRGESGTGKELITQTIHANSRRRFFPLVPVNCGALPESLLESELFGHERGAFTGARYRRKGKLEMADGGTLFLDEIGTVSLKTQVNLLRVLETKQFSRLGGTKQVEVDFRVISATNQDLEQLVREERMREDLYFRLNVVSITIPPLRERPEDIPALAQHFLQLYGRQMNRPYTDFDQAALDLLVRYPWPGNIRELANAVERALVVGSIPTVKVEDLPVQLSERRAEPAGDSLSEMEREHIQRILKRNAWNITRSAIILNIDRATLYNKIRKYKLRG